MKSIQTLVQYYEDRQVLPSLSLLNGMGDSLEALICAASVWLESRCLQAWHRLQKEKKRVGVNKGSVEREGVERGIKRCVRR